MKTLIVEDDFTSRKILQKLLSPLGDCDIAVNGKEAIDAYRFALLKNTPYELICLDIMMPLLDGQEALEEIRGIEEERGIMGLDRVKIIMTTALDDAKNVMKSFRNQADAYIVKPIDRENLFAQLKSLNLIE